MKKTATLIYDGSCFFCRFIVARIQSTFAGRSGLDFVPTQSPKADSFGIPRKKRLEAVYHIDANGKTTRGAEAIFVSIRLSSLYDVLPKVVKTFLEIAYAQVAKNRRWFSLFFKKILCGSSPHVPTYNRSTLLWIRLLGLVYVVAILSLWPQIAGLVGTDGILPYSEYFSWATTELGWKGFWYTPSLLHFFHSNEALHVFSALGVFLGLNLISFQWQRRFSLGLLWVIFLSLTHAGQVFLNFQWENLLLETGFLSIFLFGKKNYRPAIRFLLVLVLFRLYWGAGFYKIAEHASDWSLGTAMQYHFESQPIPTTLAWYAHKLPAAALKLLTHLSVWFEILFAFFFFLPRRPRYLAFLAVNLLQVGIIATGNYGYFNLLSVALSVLLLEDSTFNRSQIKPPLPKTPAKIQALVAVILLLTIAPKDIGRLFSGWRWVNRYALFARMTHDHHQIDFEASLDGKNWTPIRLRWQPDSEQSLPKRPFLHQPRLEFQLWFASLHSSPLQKAWLRQLIQRLENGSPAVESLFLNSPWPGKKKQIRVSRSQMRFSTAHEYRSTSKWWVRQNIEVVYRSKR